MSAPGTTWSTFTGADNHGFQLGQSTGPISNVFNVIHPTATPQPRPRPSSTVPFYRDRDFVTRVEFDRLWERRNDQVFRVALVGLGGVGKSQLAIEFAYRMRVERPDIWVFWVHASSAVRVEEGFRKIAERTQAPGWDGARVSVLEVVSRWLENDENGSWVLIIDSADDIDIVGGPWRSQQDQGITLDFADTRSLLDYFPRTVHGLILVTSRSREVAFQVTESPRDVIEVTPMDKATGETLLQKKLMSLSSKENAASLVQSLDCMPLAITQAAAFINQRHPRMTVSRYLSDLRQGDNERTKLLEQDVKDPRRDGESSNAIITTWHMSFEYICRSRPSAARLFALMSCFDREAIPEELLHDYHNQNTEEYNFEEDINTLRNYCLIGMNVDKGTFEMHRLVQFSIKKWLEIHQELTMWQEKHVLIMAQAFPTGEYKNWTRCQMLFPHAEAVLPYRIENVACLEAKATVLYRAVWYADEQGWHTKAETMAVASLLARRTVLGEEHSDTLASMANLASTYWNQGRWTEAETLQTKALETSERVLGEEHPHTLTSMANLALTYWNQGRWTEAETLQTKVLETSERVLGEEHPDTLTSMNNLAHTLRSQGRNKKALALMSHCVRLCGSVLGPDHPHTTYVSTTLASWQR